VEVRKVKRVIQNDKGNELPTFGKIANQCKERYQFTESISAETCQHNTN
jgi:hypothetical protein